jgi:hypothetical protein
VTGDERGSRLDRPVAVGRVDVGVAQARGLDLDKDLSRAGLGVRHILEAERLGEIVDNGCFHGGSPCFRGADQHAVVCQRSLRTVRRDRALSQPETQGLDSGVQIEDLVAHFAAPPGLLVAAEGQCSVEDVAAVDPRRCRRAALRCALPRDRVVGRRQHVILP